MVRQYHGYYKLVRSFLKRHPDRYGSGKIQCKSDNYKLSAMMDPIASEKSADESNSVYDRTQLHIIKFSYTYIVAYLLKRFFETQIKFILDYYTVTQESLKMDGVECKVPSHTRGKGSQIKPSACSSVANLIAIVRI